MFSPPRPFLSLSQTDHHHRQAARVLRLRTTGKWKGFNLQLLANFYKYRQRAYTALLQTFAEEFLLF